MIMRASEAATATAGPPMGVRTLLGYLLGRRDAILAIAQDRRAIWVGAAFVLAAGFARSYDSQDLLARSWHLALPFVVSVALATILFLLARAGMRADERYPGFAAAYRSFLTLFWMAAPLALLYAVPWERLLSDEGAIRAKLWTLAVVSLWRVGLMSRVIAVLFGIRLIAAAWIVMFLADGAVFALAGLADVPLIQFMGGVRMTARERILANLTFDAQMLSVFSLPVWLLGALVVISSRRMAWQPKLGPQSRAISRPLKCLAALVLLMWLPLLFLTQPAQRLRTQTERLLLSGHVPEALALMSAHRDNDYPPHWDPPPWPAYRHNSATPPLLDVIEAIVEQPPAPWVRAIYIAKLENTYLAGDYEYVPGGEDGHVWARMNAVLDRLPEGPILRQRNEASLSRTEQRLAVTRPAGAAATRNAVFP